MSNHRRITLVKVILTISVICVLIAGLVRHLWVQRLENAYISFNTQDYSQAEIYLQPLVFWGDQSARDMLSLMYALGLGRRPDFGKALHLRMSPTASNDSPEKTGRDSLYFAETALSGRFGTEKRELGQLWLRIAGAHGQRNRCPPIKDVCADLIVK